MDQLNQLLKLLEGWARTGFRGSLDKASRNLALDYRDKIKAGQDASGASLASLKPATLKGPVRMDGHPTPRSFYGATPLKATGATADSIKGRRVGPDLWEIAPSTEHGKMVLASNAKANHSGVPFGGDTPKAIRDPLNLSEKQMDIIEDEILKDLDRILGGGVF